MFENSGAFAPFFDTPVAIHGERGGDKSVAATVKASILDGGFDDITDDGASRVKKIIVQFPLSSWSYVDAPQVGDTLELQRRGKWAVHKVDLSLGDVYTLEARQI